MKRISILFMVLIIMVTSITQIIASPVQNDFHDIRNHWSYTEVMEAVSKGLFDGFPDGTFRPEENVTLGMALVVLDRVFNNTSNNYILEPNQDFKYIIENNFSNHKQHYAYSSYVSIMEGLLYNRIDDEVLENSSFSLGIQKMFSRNDFDELISREGLFSLISLLLSNNSLDYNNRINKDSLNESTSRYVNEDNMFLRNIEINILSEVGIVKGSTNADGSTNLMLEQPLTRAQLAAFSNRIYDYIKETDSTLNNTTYSGNNSPDTTVIEISSSQKISVEELLEKDWMYNTHIDVIHPAMHYWEWVEKDKTYMDQYIGLDKNLSETQVNQLKKEIVELQEVYYKYYNNFVDTNNFIYFPRLSMEIAETLARAIDTRYKIVYARESILSIYRNTSFTSTKREIEYFMSSYNIRGMSLKNHTTSLPELSSTEKNILNGTDSIRTDIESINMLNNLPFNTNALRSLRIYQDAASNMVDTGHMGSAGLSGVTLYSTNTDIMLHELGHIFDFMLIENRNTQYIQLRPSKDSSIFNKASWAAMIEENIAEDFVHVMQPSLYSFPNGDTQHLWGRPNDLELLSLRNAWIGLADKYKNSIVYSRYYVDGNLTTMNAPYVTNKDSVVLTTELSKDNPIINVYKRGYLDSLQVGSDVGLVETIKLNDPRIKAIDKGSYYEVSLEYKFSSNGTYWFGNGVSNRKNSKFISNFQIIEFDSSLPTITGKSVKYNRVKILSEGVSNHGSNHNIHNSNIFFANFVREGQVSANYVKGQGLNSHIFTNLPSFFYEVRIDGEVIYEKTEIVGPVKEGMWTRHTFSFMNQTFFRTMGLLEEKVVAGKNFEMVFYRDSSREEKLDEATFKLTP